MAKRVIRFVDLFSGAGGLAQGFRQASDKDVEFRPVFAVEIEPSFAASYAANFGDHVFVGPIESVKRSDPGYNIDADGRIVLGEDAGPFAIKVFATLFTLLYEQAKLPGMAVATMERESST